MRKTITALSIITLVAATSAVAEPASKEENIGVGSGALIGAAAGGPVGLVIGAAIGVKIGDKMHRKNTEIENLNVSLDSSEDEVLELKGELDTLNDNLDALSARLAHVQSIDRPALVNLMQAGIAMDLLFRTDEHALADTTGARLAELASSVATMPDIRVQLDGFADERGDADYNLELSKKRVEFVRDQLAAAGIEPSRIRITAHGEAPAQDDSIDSYALERRVSLKLFIDDSPSFAATP
jgi:outer membrane protein OmpA-like peptidoglycan-associated protein